MNRGKSIKKYLSVFLAVLVLLTAAGCAQSSEPNEKTTENKNQSLTGQADETNASASKQAKVLVAYFSATGSTEKAAQTIAEYTNGDLFEIRPVQAYTADDLRYGDNNSRVSREHNDENLRNIPLETTAPANFADYDAVFIGYPIWWGIAAWPVNNFVKENDFTGKTVIPFCTSASSGLGESDTLLRQMCGTGEWQKGKRFSSAADASDIGKWLDEVSI